MATATLTSTHDLSAAGEFLAAAVTAHAWPAAAPGGHPDAPPWQPAEFVMGDYDEDDEDDDFFDDDTGEAGGDDAEEDDDFLDDEEEDDVDGDDAKDDDDDDL